MLKTNKKVKMKFLALLNSALLVVFHHSILIICDYYICLREPIFLKSPLLSHEPPHHL